jgi:hypothetical protein
MNIIGQEVHCVILHCSHMTLMVGLYNNVCTQLMLWKVQAGN